MISWIAGNAGDIIVLSVLVLICAAVIAGMIRDRKKGRHCGGCTGCSGGASCTGNCPNRK